MNLSIKNLLVLLVCSISLLLVGCKKSSTTNYDVSVTTTGLVGSGVVVQLNGAYNLTIPSDGISTFATQLSNDTAYGVVVKSQPTLPPQTCVLANGNGTINSANVTNITLTCLPIEFAYLINSIGNSITQLVIDKLAGVLAQNSSPVPTGNKPVAFALDQTGRYAYLINQTDNTISSYLVNTTNGLLVGAGSAIATGTSPSEATNPSAVVIDPSSQYVYVANSNTATVTGFKINSTAALTCVGISGSTCPSIPTATTGNSPSALAFSKAQNGNEYLYVTNAGDNTISEYAMEVSGSALTGALVPIGTISTGNGPLAIAVTGAFVYVVNATDNTISGYTISSGNLVSIGTAISSGGSNPSAIVISPNGQFAYVVNSSTNSIAAFSIANNGVLTSLGSPLSTGNRPVSVSIEPTGTFAYVSNFTDGSISIFSINSDGTLGAATTQVMGNGPVSIVMSTN